MRRWWPIVPLVLVLAMSLVAPFLSGIDGVPDCPFGSDPAFPADSVCVRTFGGLWRSLALGLVAGGLSCGVALALSLLARWRRGASELVIEKSAELFFALPDLLVLMSLGVAVRTLQGDGRLHLPMLVVMTLSLTAIGWAGPTRQLLARLRSVEGQGFVEAAEALGQTRGRILVRHLLPYIGDYLLAIFLLRVPAVILMESTVSFLGMGLPADEPSLGAILGMHYDKLLYPGAEWVVLPAWLTLVVLVLSFQAAGKALLSGAEERR